MEFENILYAVEDGVATITLNRPKAYNALNSAINADLQAALKLVESDKSARVLIITGFIKAFAAGADITEMTEADTIFAYNYCNAAIDINNALEALNIPVIAAVNGLALGGGCELALACDFRVAGPKTVFGLPEVSLGIIPGAGGTQRLAALVGPSRAKEMVMLGRRVSGEEALSIGLVNRVVPDEEVVQAAREMARELMKNPGLALAYAKESINTAVNESINVGKGIERSRFGMLFSSHDQKEGMRAFGAKRAPEYTNS